MKRQLATTTLREVGWLSRQPADFQDELFRHAELRTFPRHATIQIAGDEPAGLFGLASGSLSVTIAPEALPHHLVQIAKPGWWFGDVALLSDGVRVVTVTAREPVEIVTINRAAVLRLAEEDGVAWKRIAQITVMHLDQALRIIAAMSIPDAELRIAFALARMTEDRDREEDEAAEVGVTQTELGDMSRMTRNAVVPALRRLEARGLITCSYRSTTVWSIKRLWQFIESASSGSEKIPQSDVSR